MLHIPTRPNGQAFNLLTGPALRRALHGKSATERAAIAAKLFQYSVNLAGLSCAQLARLCGAHESGVCIALGRRGVRGPHNRTVVRLVKKYGAPTLLQALDYATTPHLAAAE